MTNYNYHGAWCNYAYPETNQLSTIDDIIEEFGITDISESHFRKSGIPLFVRDSRAVLNNETESTIIFGETGSKKTRAIIAPLIALTAGAGESAFVTDVKGELSSNPKLQKFLRENGIRTVHLDFRNFRGDSYNILEPAFNLYRSGAKDKAITMVTKIVDSLSARHREASNDPFWEMSARQYLIPVIELIFDCCSKNRGYEDMVNMCSLSSFADSNAAETLRSMINSGHITGEGNENLFNMLKTVVSNPEKTLACIMSTVQSIIQEFTMNTELMYMLSSTSFSLDSMYERPTFVFLIVPDETSAYDTIAGMLIDIFYSRLIEVYSDRYQNKKESRCRINYICDEFCNLQINDMKAKISASRSRNMRWYLVCQSKSQLDCAYPDSASTIIGNCKNTLFLQSSDMDMLTYISNLCGTTGITRTGFEEPLITVDMLKNLRKERAFKEALFIRENIKYFTRLPDIDTYDFLKAYATKEAFVFENRCLGSIRSLTPRRFRNLSDMFDIDKAIAEMEGW